MTTETQAPARPDLTGKRVRLTKDVLAGGMPLGFAGDEGVALRSDGPAPQYPLRVCMDGGEPFCVALDEIEVLDADD